MKDREQIIEDKKEFLKALKKCGGIANTFELRHIYLNWMNGQQINYIGRKLVRDCKITVEKVAAPYSTNSIKALGQKPQINEWRMIL